MPYYETALNQYLIETDNVSIEDKARLMTQAILALRDLVRAGAQAHRDITMDQYMIHLDAQNKPHVRLTDFTSVRWEKDESDTGNIFCGKASWSVLPDEAYKAIIEDKPGSILLDLWGLGVLCEKMFDEHPKLQAFVKRCKLEGYDWTTQREKILQLNKDKNESQESRLAYIQEFIDDFSAVLRTQFELNTSTLVPQEPVPCATRDICLTLTLSRGRLVDEDDKDNDIAYPCHCLQDVVLAAGEAFALGNNIVVFAMPDGASCKVFYEKEPAKVLSLCGDSITLPHGEQIQWIHTTEAQR
ncbi:MAG: hypothetical protein LBN05_02655 [Oscillospiraceae bacterium]|nr:hypothetical protein [Oscillospiraceae bacterium]